MVCGLSYKRFSRDLIVQQKVSSWVDFTVTTTTNGCTVAKLACREIPMRGSSEKVLSRVKENQCKTRVVNKGLIVGVMRVGTVFEGMDRYANDPAGVSFAESIYR